MATEIEARRLNGTDLGKHIRFPETAGSLEVITHGALSLARGVPTRYVQLSVNGENHVLRPSDKVTLTGKKDS